VGDELKGAGNGAESERPIGADAVSNLIGFADDTVSVMPPPAQSSRRIVVKLEDATRGTWVERPEAEVPQNQPLRKWPDRHLGRETQN
jgi:hypothetical protein